MSQKKESPRAREARLAGEVLYRGRYMTRRAVFERIKASPEWAGAEESEDSDCWILARGSAMCWVARAGSCLVFTISRAR